MSTRSKRSSRASSSGGSGVGAIGAAVLGGAAADSKRSSVASASSDASFHDGPTTPSNDVPPSKRMSKASGNSNGHSNNGSARESAMTPSMETASSRRLSKASSKVKIDAIDLTQEDDAPPSKRSSKASSSAALNEIDLARDDDGPSKRSSKASSRAQFTDDMDIAVEDGPPSKRSSKVSIKADFDQQKELARGSEDDKPKSKRSSKASSAYAFNDISLGQEGEGPPSKRSSKASSKASAFKDEIDLTRSEDMQSSKRSSKGSSKASYKNIALTQSEDAPLSEWMSLPSSSENSQGVAAAAASGTSSKRSSKTSANGRSLDAEQGTEQRGGSKAQRLETLLLVFIHGFKGSETTTFAEFPQHLAESVQQSYDHLQVRPMIYPTYETRGSLAKAVESFVDWLTTTCVELECAELMLADADASGASTRAGGAGSVKIVLCGHSMGGLVAVDAALEIANSSCGPNRAGKLWPRICGVIAFDTPYCGVHPRVFKNTANKYHGYYQQARSTAEQLGPIVAPIGGALASWFAKGQNNGDQKRETQGQQRSSSSLWSKTLMATGALALAGTAAAGTYYGGGWTYISDHFLFVSNLWDTSAQRNRLDSLIDLPQVFFHALYNRLPPLDKGQPPRLFIVMPPADSGSGKTAESFEAVDNDTASDEIDAHTTMFYTSNSSYERLAQRAATLIVRCLNNEAQFGDQVHAQEEGDLEHGASDDEVYPVERDISIDTTT